MSLPYDIICIHGDEDDAAIRLVDSKLAVRTLRKVVVCGEYSYRYKNVMFSKNMNSKKEQFPLPHPSHFLCALICHVGLVWP